MTIGRRRFVASMAGIATLPLGLPRSSHAAIASLDRQIRNVTGDSPLREGRVKLDIPHLADNGHAVPLTILVDSPMTASDFVRSITLLSERNPRPLIASFYLGAHAGKAQVSTRVRLAGTQRLLAIAALSDGSFWSGIAEVVVTESACLDET
jgi:sulfur-oxidizing protein SoxY